MQHMFSPIPHITPAIEVMEVSDTSYYSTLYLYKAPQSSEWQTAVLIPILKQKKLTVNIL